MREALDKSLRKQLETAVIKARDIAKTAAEQVLNHLSVGDKDAANFLTDDQKKLRNRLRAHGRQLGDVLRSGEQETKHLVVEIAYEHWHRMLFARFLEQNNLLMYDEHTPISLEYCQELSQDPDTSLGTKDGWELAAKSASKMLPQIFRIESQIFELKFSPEHQRELEKIISSLHSDTFQAQDSLGWVYQFWQAQKKEEVNKSGNKIGADELSAVTQLFTEPYMISFLLDNSLGAWWISNYPQYNDILPLTYLRYAPLVAEGENTEYKETDIPAAGTFEQWPKQLSELKMLDPCCGSGHFLVATLLMLVPMRMKAEGLTADKSIEKVLSENIHGLELDQRCVEIAAFSVALEAWRYSGSSGYRELPSLNIACVGQSIKAKKEDWLSLAGNDEQLFHGLEALYDTFKDAPVLGSLINATKAVNNDLLNNIFSKLQPLFNKALHPFEIVENKEIAITAKGLTVATNLLNRKYDLIPTNVPYLGRGNQNEVLMQYCDNFYPEGKRDLAYSFFQRLVELQKDNGAISVVWPQSWLFQPYLKNFRKWIIKNNQFLIVCGLGSGAFETISGEVVNVSLLITKKSSVEYFLDYKALDLNDTKNINDKRTSLKKHPFSKIIVDKILDVSSRIPLTEMSSQEQLIGKFTRSIEGISTGDKDRFIIKFWELLSIPKSKWSYYQNSPQSIQPYTGLSELLLWENGEGLLANYSGARIQGHDAWGKKGILSCKMGNIRSTIYLGGLYDKTCVALTPTNIDVLNSLYKYSQLETYHETVRQLDARLCVATSVFESVPIKIQYSIDNLPSPYSDDPTQWVFHGHPAQSESPLQVAIARLLGYKWPAETDREMELSDEAREWLQKCESLSPYIDDDGIVCLSAVRGEEAADNRLEELLQAAFEDAWTPQLRNQLLTEVKARNLKNWLQDKFFEQHCKLFQNRPFIWHIWDGLKDGFSALVNYHKLDKANLERLTYTYLGDWIRTQEHEISDGIDGAALRLAAAQILKQRLEQIIEGEKPYDIFVRWKALDEQTIGWNIDVNDGVRLNIRSFMTVQDVGKKGAGILRAKPNIKWNKDRGKDIESAPWYKLGLKYEESKGARINNHHLTLEEKQQAKEDLE